MSGLRPNMCEIYKAVVREFMPLNPYNRSNPCNNSAHISIAMVNGNLPEIIGTSKYKATRVMISLHQPTTRCLLYMCIILHHAALQFEIPRHNIQTLTPAISWSFSWWLIKGSRPTRTSNRTGMHVAFIAVVHNGAFILTLFMCDYS